jgi:hypothetical protein
MTLRAAYDREYSVWRALSGLMSVPGSLFINLSACQIIGARANDYNIASLLCPGCR